MSEEQIPEENERIFTLSEPLNKDGKIIKTLNLDTNTLKGGQHKSLEREYRKRYRDAMAAPFFDIRYREMVVAQLNSLIPEDLEALPGDDYNGVMSRILSFLGSRV